jgi:alpha-L-rhamnosidase
MYLKIRLIFSTLVLLLRFENVVYCKEPGLKITNLKCEYLPDPVSIESQHPTLSWQLTSVHRAKSQKAYHILVASSIYLLDRNTRDYSNSGVVHSSNSTQVLYRGKPLPSRTKVYWKVAVWDEKNVPSGWSHRASWSMGLLNAADWKARWIGAFTDPYPDSPITFPHRFFEKNLLSIKR